jgi:hypothetical protein
MSIMSTIKRAPDSPLTRMTNANRLLVLSLAVLVLRSGMLSLPRSLPGSPCPVWHAQYESLGSFSFHHHHVRLAYQPPATVFFSQNKPATSQQYFSIRTNQHQSSATSQTNRLHIDRRYGDNGGHKGCWKPTTRRELQAVALPCGL